MIQPGTALLLAVSIMILLFLLFRPRRGLIPAWRRSRRCTQRVRCEDALKHLHRLEMQSRSPRLESLAGAMGVSLDAAAEVVEDLEDSGLVSEKAGVLHLTPKGRESALHILRAHRLLEKYMADQTGYGQLEWHGRAEELEHTLTPEEADTLASQLGYPLYDPHGDPIPSADGDVVPITGSHLSAAQPGEHLFIVHIEDEPDNVYAKIVAEGLHPGMDIYVEDNHASSIEFSAGGIRHSLPHIVAANISTRPIRSGERTLQGMPLSGITPGEHAEVIGILPSIRGLERRRLLDLGILPGTVIRAEFDSPQNDPTAYRIRDTLIALRDEQAQSIIMKHVEAT